MIYNSKEKHKIKNGIHVVDKKIKKIKEFL